MINDVRTMTEEQRNEVFLQSQSIRETTFRQWLDGKDIVVPDADTLSQMSTNITQNQRDIAQLKTHNHNDIYSKKDHNHNTEYAVKNHNHNSTYALVEHNHDTEYATKNHSHGTTYATLNHNHDGVYASNTHNHDSQYSTKNHNHDTQYASKSSEHAHANLETLNSISNTDIQEWKGNIKYITKNNLDITTLAVGKYACVASRFPVGLPLSGYDEGYVDIEITENVNGDNNENVRRTVVVHYNYSERTFIGHIHHTHGLTEWVELEHNKGLQPFYEPERELLYSKINGVSNEHCKTIGFITDTHYIKDTRGEYSMLGLRHMQNIIDVVGYGIGDLIVHGGDMINGKGNNKVITTELMDVNRVLLNSPIPVFPCKGNHDNGSWKIDNQDDKSYDNNILTGVRWNQLVTSKYINKYGFVGDKDNSGCNYGYYDFPDVKLRCIMLDVVDNRKEDITDANGNVTTGTTTFCIGQKQMNWFVNKALNFPSDEWNVVVFSHIAWYSPNDTTVSRVRNGYQIHRILKALNEHTSDSCNNSSQPYGTVISCDFTNTNHKVVATICGHNHQDAFFEKEGINYIYCKNSACDFATKNDPTDVDGYRALMNTSEDSWSTFTIDTLNRKIHLFRFGSGKNIEGTLSF